MLEPPFSIGNMLTLTNPASTAISICDFRGLSSMTRFSMNFASRVSAKGFFGIVFPLIGCLTAHHLLAIFIATA